MEGNVEAVPHIDLLRQIQPLVLDGLDYSKAVAPTLLRLLPPLTRPPSLQSLLMQLMALVEDKVQSIRSALKRNSFPLCACPSMHSITEQIGRKLCAGL